MAKESTLTLTLRVDDQGTVVLDKFTKNIQKASDDVTKMSKAMQVVSVAAFINIGQQAVNAMTRVYEFGRSIASAGNDIQRMSRIFNMTTDEFQKWSYVAKMADVDIEGFGQGFKFLTRSMSEALQGTGDAAKAFQLLGISLKDSTGKTKDQQTVMMETIGALEKYADGVNRDAMMLAVFGRGWISFKPLVDQGTKAIEENKKEAERWNLIIGKDVIKSLSESEDSFKRWSMTWNVVKMQVLSPAVELIGHLIERILALKRAWQEGGFKGVYQDVMAAQEEQRVSVLPPAAWTKEWVAGWTPPVMKKPQAPGLPTKEGEKANKEWYESLGKAAEQMERMAYGWENAAFWEEIKEAREEAEKLHEAFVKDAAAAMKFLDEADLEKLNDEYDKYGMTLDEIADRLEYSKLMHQAWLEEYTKVSELQKVWENFGNTLSSVWAENVSGMIKGTTTFKDAFINMTKGIADAFVSAVMKMVTQWLLFKSLGIGEWSGEKGSFGTSWIGGALKSIFSFFGEGAIVNRPTPAIIGEVPEAVIPLKDGKIPIEGGGRQNITIINISAMDTISIDDALRRNAFSILKIVNQDAKTAGTMRPLAR